MAKAKQAKTPAPVQASTPAPVAKTPAKGKGKQKTPAPVQVPAPAPAPAPVQATPLTKRNATPVTTMLALNPAKKLHIRAAHNAASWAIVSAALPATAGALAALLPDHAAGGASFVSYLLRRGYLVEVA